MAINKTNEGGSVKSHITQITINGQVMKDNECSSKEVRIRLKDFPNLIVSSVNGFYEDERIKTEDGSYKKTDVSLNHIEILKYLNNCLSFEVTSEGITIETERYSLFVVVQK